MEQIWTTVICEHSALSSGASWRGVSQTPRILKTAACRGSTWPAAGADISNIGTMVHTVARTCGTIGRGDLADILNRRGPTGSVGSMLARTATECAGDIPELAHLFVPDGSSSDAQKSLSVFSRKMVAFQAATRAARPAP